MRKEQWEMFKQVAKSGEADRVPVALIIDSPWMPGYLGISFPEYYFDPEVWFNANLRIIEEFPDVIFFPSWWVEYGMAIEPSALGCRIHFAQNHPPLPVAGAAAAGRHRRVSAGRSTGGRPDVRHAPPISDAEKAHF